MEEDHPKNLPTNCRICKNNLEDRPWVSEWEADQHYKTTVCDKCEKKHWVRVEFLGSGEDNWKLREDDEDKES